MHSAATVTRFCVHTSHWWWLKIDQTAGWRGSSMVCANYNIYGCWVKQVAVSLHGPIRRGNERRSSDRQQPKFVQRRVPKRPLAVHRGAMLVVMFESFIILMIIIMGLSVLFLCGYIWATKPVEHQEEAQPLPVRPAYEIRVV